MDYDKEIIERLTKIESGQQEIMRRLNEMTKSMLKMNDTIFDHEKRLSNVEFGLRDHIKDYEKDRTKIAWRYSLIIPLLVSGAVAMTDLIMRLLGY